VYSKKITSWKTHTLINKNELETLVEKKLQIKLVGFMNLKITFYKQRIKKNKIRSKNLFCSDIISIWVIFCALDFYFYRSSFGFFD